MSNRALVLQHLYGVRVENLGDAQDIQHMIHALQPGQPVVDVGHAGTAFRFMTAVLAATAKVPTLLTGSERMQQRPIGVLVDLLREMGAQIDYAKADGYPPLTISPATLSGGTYTMDASVSSQYVTAAMLIAPKLDGGLRLEFPEPPTSLPYIEMTAALMRQCGFIIEIGERHVQVAPGEALPGTTLIVEPDWSSASYWYSWVTLAPIGTRIELPAFTKNSLQGDSDVAKIYRHFGVETTYHSTGVILERKDKVWIQSRFRESEKSNIYQPTPSSINTTHKRESNPHLHLPLSLHLLDTPDLAQTIAVTGRALGMTLKLTGLHTLRIKETDRIAALDAELTKTGAEVTTGPDWIVIDGTSPVVPHCSIATYQDHRMALAFAPLASLIPLHIESPAVVEKSYPLYWEQVRQLRMDN